MAITFHPKPGTILICDFDTGFSPPEIVKKRPVVVLSKSHQQLVSVVPISTTRPQPIEVWHHLLQKRSVPRTLPRWWLPHWVKCDIVMTVAFWRLDRIKIGKHPTTGKRMYATYAVCAQDLASIRKAVASALGLTSP